MPLYKIDPRYLT